MSERWLPCIKVVCKLLGVKKTVDQNNNQNPAHATTSPSTDDNHVFLLCVLTNTRPLVTRKLLLTLLEKLLHQPASMQTAQEESFIALV
jgi:hypothetical protein